MPPNKEVRGRPCRRNVEEPEVPNALNVKYQGEVTNDEFCKAIRMLRQVVSYQVGQQIGAQQEGAYTSRIQEFLRMNPPIITCLNTTDDRKNIVEELKKVFNVMHVIDA